MMSRSRPIREFDMRAIKTNPNSGSCSLVVGNSSGEKTYILRNILRKFASDNSIHETYTITDEREAFSRPVVYNRFLVIETTGGVPITHRINNPDVGRTFEDIYKKQCERVAVQKRRGGDIPGILIVVRTRTFLPYMRYHRLFTYGPRHLNTSFVVVQSRIRDVEASTMFYYDHIFLVQGKKNLDSFYKKAIRLLAVEDSDKLKKVFRRNACVVCNQKAPTTVEINRLRVFNLSPDIY